MIGNHVPDFAHECLIPRAGHSSAPRNCDLSRSRSLNLYASVSR